MMIPKHLPTIGGSLPCHYEIQFWGLTVLLTEGEVAGWVARLKLPDPLRYLGLAAKIGQHFAPTPQAALDALGTVLWPALGAEPKQLQEADAYVSHGEVVSLRQDVEQLRVQLAGCLAAADGATNDPAVEHSYGWSVAYQHVLELRKAHDDLADRLNRATFSQRRVFEIRLEGWSLDVCEYAPGQFVSALIEDHGPGRFMSLPTLSPRNAVADCVEHLAARGDTSSVAVAHAFMVQLVTRQEIG